MGARTVESSLLLGDDLNLLSDGEGSLLAGNHSLESLDVSEVGTGGSLFELLGNGHLGPLGSKSSLLGSLNEGTSAATTLNGELHLGQRQSLQGKDHSWEVFSIDKDSVLISDVNDGDHLSVVISEVNESNSACFNEIFVSLYA